jgi:hypothetical protein
MTILRVEGYTCLLLLFVSVYCFPHYCGYTISVFQGTRTMLWGGKCEARGEGGVVGVRRDDKERRRGRLR